MPGRVWTGFGDRGSEIGDRVAARTGLFPKAVGEQAKTISPRSPIANLQLTNEDIMPTTPRVVARLTAPIAAVSVLLLALAIVAAWYVRDMQERASGPIAMSVASVTAAQELE